MSQTIFMLFISFLILMTMEIAYKKAIVEKVLEIRYLILFYVLLIIVIPSQILGLVIILGILKYAIKNIFIAKYNDIFKNNSRVAT